MTQLTLAGINGQHLWGFLAALGALSLLDEHARKTHFAIPRLAFKEDGAAVFQSEVEEKRLPAVLLRKLKDLRPDLENKLREIDKPADFTKSSYEKVARGSDGRATLDFLAGLACVVGEEPAESTLCAANGSGHQNLIQSMRDILNLVEEDHVRRALFETWRKDYRVPDDKRRELGLGSRKPTLRLDPSDERLYALRLSNPTTSDDFTTELGAQALAIPAFRLLPVVPTKHPLTVASKRAGSRVTFSWMLWKVFATLPTIRSLLWQGVGDREQERRRDVFAAFSADRVSGAKGKLFFAPSVGIW